MLSREGIHLRSFDWQAEVEENSLDVIGWWIHKQPEWKISGTSFWLHRYSTVCGGSRCCQTPSKIQYLHALFSHIIFQGVAWPRWTKKSCRFTASGLHPPPPPPSITHTQETVQRWQWRVRSELFTGGDNSYSQSSVSAITAFASNRAINVHHVSQRDWSCGVPTFSVSFTQWNCINTRSCCVKSQVIPSPQH